MQVTLKVVPTHEKTDLQEHEGQGVSVAAAGSSSSSSSPRVSGSSCHRRPVVQQLLQRVACILHILQGHTKTS